MNQKYQMVVLCGGMATRIFPVTEKIPKSLLPINGKPFIKYQLDLLNDNGFTDVVLCVGYLGREIELIIKNKYKDINIQYSYDGDTYLGTAGAIRKALYFLNDSFFVMYGDSYLNVEYDKIQKKFAESNKLSMITVFKNNDLYDKSNVLFEDEKVKLYSKEEPTPDMQYIDYGLSIYDQEAFFYVKDGEKQDLSKLMKIMISQGMMDAYEIPTEQRFYEVGSFQGIKDFSEYVRKNGL
jgi:NDP-sugar pyrophosphorylase family protein